MCRFGILPLWPSIEPPLAATKTFLENAIALKIKNHLLYFH